VPVGVSGTDGVVPIASAVARQGSSSQAGNVHVSSALQVAVPAGENPVGQVAMILPPVVDIGTDGNVPSAVAGQGSSLQYGNTHVSSALQVAGPDTEYPTGQVKMIPLPVGDSGPDGVASFPTAITSGQGSSTQVGNTHVSSGLQVAVPSGEYPTGQVTEIPKPVSDSGTVGLVPSYVTAGHGSSMQVGRTHVSSSLQVAVPSGEYPTGQVAEIPRPVSDSGTTARIPSKSTAGQGSSKQIGNVHVSSALQVAVPCTVNPIGQVASIPLPVGALGADGKVPASVGGQGSSLQVGNSHVSSALQTAVPVVEYPVAQVTAMPLPVFVVGADGVAPLATSVAGQGWSMQVGNVHVSSALQVAVEDVDHPVAQVAVIPWPVGVVGTDGLDPLASAVAWQGSSMQVGNCHVSSALQVAVPDGENPMSHVTGISPPVADVGTDGVVPSAVPGQGSSLHWVSPLDASSPGPDNAR
jgi:hypothetical protein